jgi:hypothetical protein
MGELLTKETNMNRIAIALLASAAALAANSARADTRVSIGVNVGTPVYRTPAPAIVYAPAPAVVYAPAPAVVVAPPRGYWKEVVVKTWVPERWVTSRDRWGRHVRVCEPGYFTYRTDRMWVDAHSDRGHHYGHDNRAYSYGYNHDHGRDSRGGWNR